MINSLCDCENDEIFIRYKELWIEDCEGIMRCYDINYCPFCGIKFEDK